MWWTTSVVESSGSRDAPPTRRRGRLDLTGRDSAGLLSGSTEGVDASREVDHLGDPVAPDEERVEPFEAQRGRPRLRLGGPFGDALDSTTEIVHDIVSAAFDLASTADVRDVPEDVLQRVRI